MSSETRMEVEGMVHLDEIGIVEKTKFADLEKIHSFIDKRNGEKSLLIPILFDIEAEYDCLPENALEYVAKRLGIQISELSSTIKRKKEAGIRAGKFDTPEYYPQCPDCGTRLTDIPFTDVNTVVVKSFMCPKCGKDHWFYIDLEKMFRRKNKWCPTCGIFTRNYTDNNERSVCGGEVYRTKSRTNKERAIEYYPKCPDCDKHHWLYIDMDRCSKVIRRERV